MNNPDHISESLETPFFGGKILKFFDAHQGSGMEKNSDPGSGMEKIRIRLRFMCVRVPGGGRWLSRLIPRRCPRCWAGPPAASIHATEGAGEAPPGNAQHLQFSGPRKIREFLGLPDLDPSINE